MPRWHGGLAAQHGKTVGIPGLSAWQGRWPSAGQETTERGIGSYEETAERACEMM